MPDVVTVRFPDLSPFSPWGRAVAFRRSDAAVLGVIGAYVGAVFVGAGAWGDGPVVANFFYALIALPTIAQTFRVARLTAPGPNRLAWTLLAVSLLVRFTAGAAWRAWRGTGPDGADPLWLAAAGLTYMVFQIPALLTFESARWRGRDSLRGRIDTAMVLGGSILIVWFLAIGPMLRSAELATAPLDDRVYALGDSIAVVLAAALFLRAGTDGVRRAAGWLIVSYTLRLAPDLLIWKGLAPDLSFFSAVGASWFGVWVFQWAAARAAEAVDSRSRALPASRRRYESGPVPHAFLAATAGMLLFQLGAGDSRDAVLFAAGSAVLTLLLVARQRVELDERDRLTHRIDWERARFEALLQHAYDAVALIGPGGHLRYASPGTARLLGDRLHASGRDGLISLVHPEDRLPLLTALADTDVAVHAVRIRVQDRLDHWRTIEGQLHDHRHDPLIDGVVLHGVDRTREREMTEGLELTQPLEALGVLAGGLAHDLNNILTVVVSHGELLAVDDSLDPRARGDVDAIRAASDRARSLTRGLLTLSRKKDDGAGRLDVTDAVQARTDGSRQPPLDLATDGARHVRMDAAALAQVLDAVVDVAAEEAHGQPIRVSIGECAVDEPRATVLRVDAKLYVAISAGTGDGLGTPDSVEESVRTESGDEWDLAPGDLALLIGLAACREVGGTIVRERRASGTRLVALLPAALQ